MRKWIVRFASLFVFNVVVLLVIGWLTPARVGWSALWAGIVLTALALWVKPLVTRWFRSRAAKSAGQRTKLGERLAQLLIALIVAFIVWIATVLLSGVSIHGWLWGYILPPVILVIGWAVYAAIDDRVEAHAGVLYDRATGGQKTDAAGESKSVDATPAQPAAVNDDGLTAEQRRMLDELGKS